MSLISIFKPRQDAFTLGRCLPQNLLIEASPIEKTAGIDVSRCVNESLLVQFFLLNWVAIVKWGDEGAGERLLHGLRAGFTEKYPHLAPRMGEACLNYAHKMPKGATAGAIWDAACYCCEASGLPGRDGTSVATVASWIEMTGTSFFSAIVKIGDEYRLT